MYPVNSKVLIKVAPESFPYHWNAAKEKKGRYIVKDLLHGLDAKYAGQEATVITLQLEENSLKPAHRLGPSDDDVLDPYFSIVVRFEDGTVGMTTTYLIIAKTEIIPAETLRGRQEALRQGATALMGKTVFAVALSQFYYPDLTTRQAMAIAANFTADVDQIKNVPLLQPLQITNVGYLKEADALIVTIQLPDGRKAVSVVVCDGNGNSCFENNGSYLLSAIPSYYTAREIEAIQHRSLFKGMSGSAVHDALGSPDSENDYGSAGKQLVYYGGRLLVYLDQNDKVEDRQRFDK